METLNVLVNATVSRKRVRVKSGAVAGSIENIAGYQRCGCVREEAAAAQVGSLETMSPEMRKARRVAEVGGGDESGGSSGSLLETAAAGDGQACAGARVASAHTASEGHGLTQLPRAGPHEAPLAAAAENVLECAGDNVQECAGARTTSEGTENGSATLVDIEGVAANHPFTPSDKRARFLGSPSQDSALPPANQVRPPISLVSSRRGSCLQNVMCQGVARHVAPDLRGVPHPLSLDRALQEMDIKGSMLCHAEKQKSSRVLQLYDGIKKIRIDR